MPQIAFMILLILVLPGCGQAGGRTQEQHKQVQSRIAWKRLDLYDGKQIKLISPNGILSLNYDSEGLAIHNSTRGSVDLDVTAPASVLWRPNGNGVAINNGNGSGQMSELIIVGGDAKVISGIESKLKAYFFNHTGCRPESKAVSVSAEGWSIDSSSVWVRFESWDREALCNGEPVSFGQFDVARGQVLSHLSSSQAMDSFCPDREFRGLFGPNCSRHEQGKSGITANSTTTSAKS